MHVILDVVYNHTSRDSVLIAQHPEFYWKAADGSMGNRFGDWTDVYDLDYRCRELWDYQVQTLKFWAGIVDGFRCDVASCVTPEFWTYARKAVSDVNPDCIWLAETVHRSFVIGAREQGLQVWSDSEIFTAFDISYQYDIHEKFMACFEGSQTMETALSAYIYAVNSQEFIYPANFVKLRFVENHDNERFATLCPDRKKRMEWLRFMFFQKGTMLIYGGQEFSCTHTPSLFEKETFPRTGEDISATIADLAKMKKSLPTDAVFQAKVVKGTHVEASYISNGKVVAKQEFDL